MFCLFFTVYYTEVKGQFWPRPELIIYLSIYIYICMQYICIIIYIYMHAVYMYYHYSLHGLHACYIKNISAWLFCMLHAILNNICVHCMYICGMWVNHLYRTCMCILCTVYEKFKIQMHENLTASITALLVKTDKDEDEFSCSNSVHRSIKSLLSSRSLSRWSPTRVAASDSGSMSVLTQTQVKSTCLLLLHLSPMIYR